MHSCGIGSLSELARKAGVHRSTLNHLLLGERSPISDSLVRIAAVLKTSPLELLGHKYADEDENLKYLQEQLSLLVANYSELAMVLIGSRAKNKATKFSDWDIGITAGKKKIDTDLYLNIKEKILSLLDSWSYSVDVINLDSAPEWFLEEMNYSPVFLAGNKQSFAYFGGWLDAKRNIKEVA